MRKFRPFRAQHRYGCLHGRSQQRLARVQRLQGRGVPIISEEVGRGGEIVPVLAIMGASTKRFRHRSTSPHHTMAGWPCAKLAGALLREEDSICVPAIWLDSRAIRSALVGPCEIGKIGVRGT